MKAAWKLYFSADDKGDDVLSAETKIDYMQMIRISLSLFEWLCINDKHSFIFSKETGRENLTFVINLLNITLCQFRMPI